MSKKQMSKKTYYIVSSGGLKDIACRYEDETIPLAHMMAFKTSCCANVSGPFVGDPPPDMICVKRNESGAFEKVDGL